MTDEVAGIGPGVKSFILKGHRRELGSLGLSKEVIRGEPCVDTKFVFASDP